MTTANYGYTQNNDNAAAPSENSSDNSGANLTQLMGCRIAGPGDYIPAYMKPGQNKVIQAKCKIAVYQNVRGKKLKFEVTAWGKLADAIAKYGATGKAITIFGELNPYKGRVWMQTPPGTPRQCYTDASGQPIMSDKVGITIKSMNLGADSAKTIDEEIAAGIRPVGWNDTRSPGKQQWLNICAQRKAMQFQEGMQFFGYARVTLPENGSIIVGNAANNAQGGYGGYNGQTGQAQQVQQVQQVQQPNQNWQNTVQQQQVGGYGGYQNQPNAQVQVQQPVQNNNGGYGGYGGYQPRTNQQQGAPVTIAGQHMGYQMPANQQQVQNPNNGGYGGGYAPRKQQMADM